MMKDVNFSEIVEEIIRDKATEIVDKAIPTKCSNFTRDDLISLVTELLKELDKRDKYDTRRKST